MAISLERKIGNKLRKTILERDNFKCVICGSYKDLEVHHMQALYRGGNSKENNLVTLCNECHQFAPEDSIESNLQYFNERNKDIYKRMVKEPGINSMITVLYFEFLSERINKYVELGFIDEQQKNLILMLEANQSIGEGGKDEQT